jgi:hypothetical protein
MPRRSRIDKPEPLYRITARGNEERKIFQDDFDRNNFPDRLGQILRETKTPLQAQGIDVAKIATRISQLMGVEPLGIWAPGKERKRVNARSLLCYWAVRDLGINMAGLPKRLGLSPYGVSQSVRRGE